MPRPKRKRPGNHSVPCSVTTEARSQMAAFYSTDTSLAYRFLKGIPNSSCSRRYFLTLPSFLNQGPSEQALSEVFRPEKMVWKEKVSRTACNFQFATNETCLLSAGAWRRECRVELKTNSPPRRRRGRRMNTAPPPPRDERDELIIATSRSVSAAATHSPFSINASPPRLSFFLSRLSAYC